MYRSDMGEKMNWRDKQPTEKQIELIKEMHSYCRIPDFEGKTRGEASDYIDKYMDIYKLETTSAWCLEHGYF